MKSTLITFLIIAGLSLLLWGTSRYIKSRFTLQQTEATFANDPDNGNSEEQKKVLHQLEKSVKTAFAIIAAGGLLLFVIIAQLNKTSDYKNLLKQSSKQQ